MANTIRLKRRLTGSTSAPANLMGGEVAFNEVDSSLWYGAGDDGNGNATNMIPIGGKGRYLDLVSTQTVGGIKTFSALPTIPVTPVNPGDAASKGYVDSQIVNSSVASFNGRTGAVTLVASDIPTFSAAKISDLSTYLAQFRLDQLTAPTASVSFGNQTITNLGTPVNTTDAATKGYVDAIAQGLSNKQSCVVGTTANVNISSPGATIDGTAMTAGYRVLLMGQTTASQNGIYVWNGASAAMTRSTDSSTAAQVLGSFTFVEQGTNADNGFTMITDAPITMETTALQWTQFSGAGQVLVGTGLSKNGNTLSINSNYAGQNSITVVGTIAAGVWNGTAVALAYGGTGATTAAGARTNLGLGTMSTQNANAVAITGGTIDNVIIDGGTF